jgi:5'-nucleotidase
MHILVTNDDGIDAPGLAALVEVARSLGDVTVIAPDQHRSGCSHSATSDAPLRLVEREPRVYALSGTPVDCVRVALLHLTPEIDLVLSGINDGGNLGVDVLMSGTVAAAREGVLLGRRAVAVSQYRRRGRRPDWQRSIRMCVAALDHILRQPSDNTVVWNVNLPDVDGEQLPRIVTAPLDRHPLPIGYQPVNGALNYVCNYHQRPRDPESDVAVCFSGQTTVTKLVIWDGFASPPKTALEGRLG